MKKDMSFVGLPPELIRWLNDRLHSPEAKEAGAGELAEGIRDLMDGRITALMLEEGRRDATAPAGDSLLCGELEISPRLRRVTLAGEEVSLTPKEFDILFFLALNKGEVFTKEQIYRAVWAEDYLMDDSNIMAFIRKLRKKIEPNPDAPRFILTIWGIGYKFNDKI